MDSVHYSWVQVQGKMSIQSHAFLYMNVCPMMTLITMWPCWNVTSLNFGALAKVSVWTVTVHAQGNSVVATCSLRCWKMTVVEFYMKDVFWKPVIWQTSSWLHHCTETAIVISRTVSILESIHTCKMNPRSHFLATQSVCYLWIYQAVRCEASEETES